ncbi:MAG: FadR/GntR family transcriptional regulator [Acidimicrobiales bacterium]
MTRGDDMWQPVRQEGTLAGRIANRVEELIRDESLRPGDRLPSEREMAQMLGVSRPSLREAVRSLEARGRLVVRHGQGVFVQEPRSGRELRHALASIEVSLKELFAMREVLEVPAGAWAAERITEAQLDNLRATLDKISTALSEEPKELGLVTQLDVDFHLGIAAAADNRFLRQTSHVLHDMILSGMETTLAIPGRPERARHDHEQILAALESRDGPAVRRAVRAHIRGAYQAAVRRIHDEGSAS